MSRVPEYAAEVPYVPVNWYDRDNITGRILEILEAVLPEGKQLTATKNLVKDCTKQYFIHLFNDQYDVLSTHLAKDNSKANPLNDFRSEKDIYFRAIWDVAQTETALPVDPPHQEIE